MSTSSRREEISVPANTPSNPLEILMFSIMAGTEAFMINMAMAMRAFSEMGLDCSDAYKY